MIATLSDGLPQCLAGVHRHAPFGHGRRGATAPRTRQDLEVAYVGVVEVSVDRMMSSAEGGVCGALTRLNSAEPQGTSTRATPVWLRAAASRARRTERCADEAASRSLASVAVVFQ